MAGNKVALVASTNTIVESTPEENERIADQVMEFLLAREDITDPSVLLTVTTGELEVEMLVENIDTLDEAQSVGHEAVAAALHAAGVEMVGTDRQSAELLPA